MTDGLDKKKIRKVFRDAQKHVAIAQLIRRFSTNKADIRRTALDRLELSSCRNVLELGCAFGAFTQALQGRLYPEAKITGIDIIPEYKPFFMEACRRAGYAGQFHSSGIERMRKFSGGSFDLIICSYALYFFPEIIPEISRVLKKDGVFVTITHSHNDMHEIVGMVREILRHNDSSHENQPLPIEIIFEQFSAENGKELLQPFFSRLEMIDFTNTLVFQFDEIGSFLDYFQFKKSFFLTGNDARSKTIIHQLENELKNAAMKNRVVTMCKDDKIFICHEPLNTKDA